MTTKKTAPDGTVSRRSVIQKGAKVTGAAAAASSFPLVFTNSANAFTNDPGNASTVKFGFNVPQSGPYADEGADQLLGYKLAVKHINGEGDGGLLNTMKPLTLDGSGINGKKVEYVTGDTQTKTDAARASAKSMIEKDGVTMITGGSSSGTAIAMQSLCQEAGIVFMSCVTHSNDTTGKDKKRNGFRYFFNAYMSAAALAPVLEESYGTGRKVYQLTADYTWGHSIEESMIDFTNGIGWETIKTVRTPLATNDFSEYIAPILNSGADTLILNHYGGNMINSLSNAVQFGLRDKVVNGKQFEIIVPLYSRLMAQGAGDALKGVFGSSDWHWSLQDEGSKTFTQSYGKEYNKPPSQAAHTAYVQTMLYADACQRTQSFNPCAIVEALEDYRFEGLGGSSAWIRGEDHQTFKDVLVLKGKENPENEYDLLEIVNVTPAEKVMYDVEHKMFAGGQLGDCNDGS